jgi:hypothetical protein
MPVVSSLQLAVVGSMALVHISLLACLIHATNKNISGGNAENATPLVAKFVLVSSSTKWPRPCCGQDWLCLEASHHWRRLRT